MRGFSEGCPRIGLVRTAGVRGVCSDFGRDLMVLITSAYMGCIFRLDGPDRSRATSKGRPRARGPGSVGSTLLWHPGRKMLRESSVTSSPQPGDMAPAVIRATRHPGLPGRIHEARARLRRCHFVPYQNPRDTAPGIRPRTATPARRDAGRPDVLAGGQPEVGGHPLELTPDVAAPRSCTPVVSANG